jgi:hypothetical protein
VRLRAKKHAFPGVLSVKLLNSLVMPCTSGLVVTALLLPQLSDFHAHCAAHRSERLVSRRYSTFPSASLLTF